MENVLKIENILLYSLSLILCFLLKLTNKEIVNNEKEKDDDFLFKYFTIAAGIFLGFIICFVINNPSVIPPQKYWLGIITVSMAIASFLFPIVMFILCCAALSIITKIGIVSIIGGWFLFLSFKNSSLIFILFFLLALTIGLTLGWATKKTKKKMLPT